MHSSAPDGTDHGGRRYCRTCSRGGQRRESAQDAVILSGYTWMEQAKDAVDTVENATDEDLAYIVEKDCHLPWTV